MMRRFFLAALAAAAASAACAGDQAVAPRDRGAEGLGDPSAMRVLSDTMRPGTDIVIEGQGFSTSREANLVLVDGQAASVLHATPSTLTVRLGIYSCRAAGDAAVEVSAGGVTTRFSHPIRTGTPLILSTGDAELILDGSTARCIELAERRGRYLISVFNISTSAAATTEFRLSGRASDDVITSASARQLDETVRAQRSPLAHVPGSVPRSPGPEFDPDSLRRAMETHRRVLAISQEALRDGPPPAVPSHALTVSGSAARGVVGEILSLKVPNIRTSNACVQHARVGARTVYAGRHALVLEDTANALAGRMDEQLRAIGREFDDVMWPIINANFGNPLAMNARLNGSGKIMMLFSREVNRFEGIAGFVIGCDFIDPSRSSRYASSNMAEILYARVPMGSGGNDTPAAWLRSMRSTIIHEVKHITSFAERYVQGAMLEEAWLEESTARHAEELYGRSFGGAAWKSNAGYVQSVFCEVRPGDSACGGRPSIMLRHFDALARYLESSATLTPLGSVAGTDYTFYGSGWAFTRWVVDQFASSEAAFLQALTQEGGVRGIGNLEKHTGRSFAELLGWWSLAMALDDRPGFRARRPELAFPSWDLRDVYRGMHQDLGRGAGSWVSEYPSVPRRVFFGSFSEDVSELRGGSAVLFELAGPAVAAGAQLLEISSRSGGAPSGTLRVGVARIE